MFMVCGDIIVESGLLNTDLFCLFHVHVLDNSIKTEFYKKPAATSKSKKRKRKSDSKKQKINSDNSLPKNDNSRMNQVEIHECVVMLTGRNSSYLQEHVF
jgi:hypothetical protein